MLKIHKQVRARKDLKGILQYSIKNWGEKQADKYYDELIKGMGLIASFPKIGITCDNIREGCADVLESISMTCFTRSRQTVLSS